MNPRMTPSMRSRIRALCIDIKPTGGGMTQHQLEVQEWQQEAAKLGQMHADNAASWVTSGNESDESRRHKLKAIEDGDPIMDSMLPPRPNLSGEFADNYDAAKLIEEVTGLQPENVADVDREAIINAWEEAVDEHFTLACENELRKWVR